MERLWPYGKIANLDSDGFLLDQKSGEGWESWDLREVNAMS